MVSMGKASYDGRFIRAFSPTLKARFCKGSIVIFKRNRFSLKAKVCVQKEIFFHIQSYARLCWGGDKIYDVVLPPDSTFLFFLCFTCIYTSGLTSHGEGKTIFYLKSMLGFAMMGSQILSRRVGYNFCGIGPHGDAPWYPNLLRRVKVGQNAADVKTHAHRYTARII
ncbi:PREDICTED: uncharacterized protein LOC105137154 [Populus euphratica]|uniref:Uncharacterized protein LOC105137154 n=1 Tax=Populus euphratica TaxID=75702 RepID=A0AAJ6V3U6_POPEU|nr:PREDICTED: uncharacterized protein LOC105137154 [Populus euphratica]